MCDYSLEGLVDSRQARIGETLVLTGFAGSMSRGFASPSEPRKAVCVMPGTRLKVAAMPDSSLPGSRFGAQIAVGSEVTFAHIDIPGENYHDGVRLASGREILLQKLPVGLTVELVPARVAHRIEEAIGIPEGELVPA